MSAKPLANISSCHEMRTGVAEQKVRGRRWQKYWSRIDRNLRLAHEERNVAILVFSMMIISPDWWHVLWPSRGPSTASMLKGSPQWRHMMTRRSGAPECEESGGPMLRWPEALCLMLSTRARRLSSITAPSLISSQSSSRKGHWRLSARFCPSSLRRRLSFSDNLVSGWKRITSGRPWKKTLCGIVYFWYCVGVVSFEPWLGLSRFIFSNKDIKYHFCGKIFPSTKNTSDDGCSPH